MYYPLSPRRERVRVRGNCRGLIYPTGRKEFAFE